MAEYGCEAPARVAGFPDPERAALIREAFRLEWFTGAWMTVEAIVAIAAGIAAQSTTLLAFGIDSLIELASAGVLIWRLSVELKHGRAFSVAAEYTASRIAGGLLLAVAAYVVVAAGWGLWHGEGQAFSLPGLIVTALAIPVMYLLAKRKLSVAAQLGSRALRADAIEAAACGWLSFVVVLGLSAQLAIGAWWLDSVTSLAILWFLIKEGREAWTGEKCGADE
jgi:divalent metal cation (Fe/Co/Zn/Cd) transporter